MRSDPIVREVREIKKKLEEKAGHDLETMFAEIKSREKQYPEKRIIRLSRRTRKKAA